MGDRPWDQRDDESAKAYAAFCVYRDMPPHQRSQKLVSDEVYGEGVRNRGWISAWSAKYDWVSRAKALDAYKAQVELEAVMSQRVEIKRRRVKLLTDYMGKFEQLLETMEDLPEADVREITGALKMVVGELRKEFDDEPAQRHHVEGGLGVGVASMDIEAMTPEEKVKAWRQLTGRNEDE